MDALLSGYCGADWLDLPEANTPLEVDARTGELTFRAIPLPGDPPRYAGATPASGGQSVALEFVDQRRGTRLLVAPDVAAITSELRAAMQAADAILFDGTFWDDEELRRVDPTARTASQMGHLPVSGGSLEALRDLPARHRIYTHINNTNPILAPGSRERAEVETTGVTVGEDGMDFEL